MGLKDAIIKRRSRYALTNASSLKQDAIKIIIEQALLHTPSPNNAQSGRIVLAFGKHHDTIWDIVIDTLKKKVSEKRFPKTKEKIDGFKKSYGTVLFFDDTEVVKTLQEKVPLYKDKFETWIHQSQGMLQYTVWTMLADAGMGASLQHYNPLIDAAVRNAFNIPKNWTLRAQMPFGIADAPPKEKHFEPLDKRLKVFD